MAEPAVMLFEHGHLSRVTGIELSDGRRVVVKVRAWQDRLVACAQVQRALFASGFPAPQPLAGPDRLDDGLAISAEQFVEGGKQITQTPEAGRHFAGSLALLIRSAPPVSQVGTLAPSPPWVAWDRAEPALWPEPDDRDGDLNAHRDNLWLDDIAGAVRTRLVAVGSPRVIGHGDYYSQNVHWLDNRLLAVHDWDSVVAQPEAAIVGQAPAVWPGTGGAGEVASVEQSEEFLDGYALAVEATLPEEWRQVSWAAGLWVRAFDAKRRVSAARTLCSSSPPLKPANECGGPGCRCHEPMGSHRA